MCQQLSVPCNALLACGLVQVALMVRPLKVIGTMSPFVHTDAVSSNWPPAPTGFELATRKGPNDGGSPGG